jgi:hypothetical protein
MKLNTPLIGVVVLITLTSGCLGSVQDQGEQPGLIVTTDSNLDRIQTVYEQGELTEQEPGVIRFDFSSSAFMEEILSFGISPGDGREDVIVDANQVQEIEVTYDKHGYYTVEAFAIDVIGERESTEIIITIEQEIVWTETNTGSPEILYFDADPGNELPAPSYFMLNSTVENPSSIIGIDGRSVSVSWSVVNPDGPCLSESRTIDDGETTTWNTLHFSPVGMHELELVIDDGQDSINVEHKVSILYELME